jgi:hypothetical protein
MSNNDPHPPQSPPPANPPPPAVEHLTGHGKVLRDGTPIMDLDYDLTVSLPSDRKSATQRMHVRDSDEPARDQASPPAERPPYLDIAGRLLGALYTGEQLLGVHTLVLEDGRELEFRVVQPDTNEIVAVSDLRAPRG